MVSSWLIRTTLKARCWELAYSLEGRHETRLGVLAEASEDDTKHTF